MSLLFFVSAIMTTPNHYGHRMVSDDVTLLRLSWNKQQGNRHWRGSLPCRPDLWSGMLFAFMQGRNDDSLGDGYNGIFTLTDHR